MARGTSSILWPTLCNVIITYREISNGDDDGTWMDCRYYCTRDKRLVYGVLDYMDGHLALITISKVIEWGELIYWNLLK